MLMCTIWRGLATDLENRQAEILSRIAIAKQKLEELRQSQDAVKELFSKPVGADSPENPIASFLYHPATKRTAEESHPKRDSTAIVPKVIPERLEASFQDTIDVRPEYQQFPKTLPELARNANAETGDHPLAFESIPLTHAIAGSTNEDRGLSTEEPSVSAARFAADSVSNQPTHKRRMRTEEKSKNTHITTNFTNEHFAVRRLQHRDMDQLASKIQGEFTGKGIVLGIVIRDLLTRFVQILGDVDAIIRDEALAEHVNVLFQYLLEQVGTFAPGLKSEGSFANFWKKWKELLSPRSQILASLSERDRPIVSTVQRLAQTDTPTYGPPITTNIAQLQLEFVDLSRPKIKILPQHDGVCFRPSERVFHFDLHLSQEQINKPNNQRQNRQTPETLFVPKARSPHQRPEIGQTPVPNESANIALANQNEGDSPNAVRYKQQANPLANVPSTQRKMPEELEIEMPQQNESEGLEEDATFEEPEIHVTNGDATLPEENGLEPTPRKKKKIPDQPEAPEFEIEPEHIATSFEIPAPSGLTDANVMFARYA
jgi:hypothetical protein